MTQQQQNMANLVLRFQSDAYQLVQKIGEGGFGQVYQAKQLNTDQNVAIKFLTLNPEFDSDKKSRYIERFERETLLTSRLQHPNIVRLLDKGRCDDDLLYAVFEYVDGETLKDTLANSGVLPPVEAAEVMTQVLDALVHAHEKGVIHRDIKPANIMLTKVGARTHAKVLDFGIGTLVNEARQLDFKSITLTQETLGTPSYSAPEQLRGEPPTPKTDLYVWGLVFIECLTGQPAISGSSLAAVFHKQLSQSNVPMPAAVVAHPVGALLRRVLQKKVHERSVNIAELYHELTQLNFSNLVGELAAEPVGGNIADRTTMVQSADDATQVFDAHQQDHQQTMLTERKQITAMCICLNVISVTEEMVDHGIVDTLHRDQKNQCVDIAIRYGAHHVGTLGNMLLFYFGYPTVSDNDTRLCARAALDIISILNKRNSLLRHSQGIASVARIGIHTGMVTRYADATPEGDTPNIAMELAREASANQILCSDISRIMLESYIEFEADQDRKVGVDGQQSMTYSLSGERQVEAFGFLRGTRRHQSFIGRETELKTLLALLATRHNDLDNAKPRLAHIHGEAGIGKSRLIFELRNQAPSFNHYVAQCLPEHQNNALYPILNVLRYQYSLDSLSANDALNSLLEAVDSLDLADQASAIAILCAWLNFPLPEDVPPTALAPDVQKQLLFSTLASLLILPQSGNLERSLFIFEDMHWADPTSIEFINLFIATLAVGQHVFVSTSRQPLPVMLNKAENNYQFNSIELLKLNEVKTTEFIVDLFDKQKVADNVLDILVSRTDGIPLFIEELVNMLQQKKLVHRLNGIIDFTSPDKLEEVPGSLRDSLQQKLDTLTYAKETGQLAATMGREFNYDLLVATANCSEAQIQTDLEELIEAELVYLQRRVSGDSYLFKHALVRDAAYESMGKEQREEAHKNIALVTEKQFPALAENNPADVARHYAGATMYHKAAEFGTKAIDKQVESSANDEAIAIGDTTLKWAAKMDDTVVKHQAQLNIHSAMLPAVMTLFGYGAKRVEDWGGIVQSLTRQLKDEVLDADELEAIDAMHKKSQWTLFIAAHYCSRRKEAREIGQKLLDKARKAQNRQDEMVVLVHLGQACNIDGDLVESMQTYEKALALYDETVDGPMALEYGMDLRVQALSLCSYNYIHFGQLAKAKDYAYQALSYAEHIGNIGEIVFANIFVALYHIFLKEFDEVKQTWQAFNTKHADKGRIFHVCYFECYCYSALKEPELSAKALQPQLDSGQLFAVGYYVTHLAEAYLEQGDVALATELMETSLQRSEKNGEASVWPFLKKTLAQCYYASDQQLTPRVEQLLVSSLQDAVDQKARYFEWENSVYYAQLLDKTGRDSCAVKANISSLYQWFYDNKEGTDTPLYRKTRQLMNLD